MLSGFSRVAGFRWRASSDRSDPGTAAEGGAGVLGRDVDDGPDRPVPGRRGGRGRRAGSRGEGEGGVNPETLVPKIRLEDPRAQKPLQVLSRRPGRTR